MTEAVFHLTDTDIEIKELNDVRREATGKRVVTCKSETSVISFIQGGIAGELVTPIWDKLIKLKSALLAFSATPLTLDYRLQQSLLEEVSNYLDRFESSNDNPLLAYLGVNSTLVKTLVDLETKLASSISKLVADVESLVQARVIDNSMYPEPARLMIDLNSPGVQVHKSLEKLFVPIEIDTEAALRMKS